MKQTNQIKGGKADNLTLMDLAKKYAYDDATDSTSKEAINQMHIKLKSELQKGIKIELEHTKDTKKANEIAMDHLSEMADYYSRLEKMEKQGDKESKNIVKKLVREHLSVIDETPLSNKYEITYKGLKVGFIEVGDCQCGLGDDTIQIFDIKMDSEYRGLKLALDTINALWKTYPDINRFVISPPTKSYDFWEHVGFTRLNDEFLILLRGH